MCVLTFPSTGWGRALNRIYRRYLLNWGMNEYIRMVRTGREKSLKKHHVLKNSLKIENCGTSLKSPWIFHISPWIFESSLNKTNLCQSKVFSRKGKIESTAVGRFSWWSWKCFLMISVFLAQFIFRYLRYPRNPASLREGIAMSKPYSNFEFERSFRHVILCQITGERSPWKVILVLEKSLISPPKFCMNHD